MASRGCLLDTSGKREPSYLGVLLLQGNTMTKSKLGRKGFVWLTLLHCSPSLKEAETGIQAGQEPGGKN